MSLIEELGEHEKARREFEQIPWVKDLISSCDLIFGVDENEYRSNIQDSFEHDPNECYINGAWDMFLELRK